MARKTDIAYLCGVSLLSLILLGATGAVRAEEPKNLEFKGTLITPPSCTISNNGTVVTDFGDKVGVRKVASGIYRENVDITLSCEENANAWQLLLTVTGNAAGFDTDNATVVTPEQADLGVKLLLGGNPFRLDEPVKVNAEGLPKLEALLVQRPDAELQEGGFTAQATLRAEYQ
ncbi:fimbrial protein [Enterobacter ludwigii]|uniref:fimbrial protein n=1 Tax=Enterobacter ludwigii TaxID=299767 RepID=UPI0013D8D49E|nr:fimbrial protein [Enterobacter ludwigii]